MAKDKKSFIAYSDWKDTFDSLPDEVAGKLIKHIFAYVNDESPSTDDYVINGLFANIRNSLKRDLEKWDNQRQQRSLAGKRSAEIRATKSNERSTVVNEKQRNPTVSVSDSVNVSVNENKKKVNIPFIDFWNLYNKKVGSKNDCEKKWNNLKNDDRLAIIKTLPNFISQIKDKKFQPFPSTYLKQRRWEDEIEIKGKNKDENILAPYKIPTTDLFRVPPEILEARCKEGFYPLEDKD